MWVCVWGVAMWVCVWGVACGEVAFRGVAIPFPIPSLMGGGEVESVRGGEVQRSSLFLSIGYEKLNEYCIVLTILVLNIAFVI